MGSRSPVRGGTVCAHPTLSACSWPTCWRSGLERRAALCIRWGGDSLHCRRGSVWGLPPCLTWRLASGLHVQGRGAPASRSLRLVPSARLQSGHVLEGRLLVNGSAVSRCLQRPVGPEQGTLVASNRYGDSTRAKGHLAPLWPFWSAPALFTGTLRPLSAATHAARNRGARLFRCPTMPCPGSQHAPAQQRLTCGADLAGLAATCHKAVREQQRIVNNWTACDALSSKYVLTLGTRSQARPV